MTWYHSILCKVALAFLLVKVSILLKYEKRDGGDSQPVWFAGQPALAGMRAIVLMWLQYRHIM